MNNDVKQGMIENQQTRQMDEYQLAWLDDRHLDAMEAVQDVVVQSLLRPELLVKSPRETLRQNLREQGITLGLFVREKLCGYFALHFFAYDLAIKQADINFQSHILLPPEEIAKTAYYKQIVIHPDYRGNSLMKEMVTLTVNQAMLVQPGLRYFCATAAPNNLVSIKQLFNDDMLVVAMFKNRHNWWRLIFFQDVLEPLILPTANSIVVPCKDVERQLTLLRSGYYGVGIQSDGELLFEYSDHQRWREQGH